jgi:epoxide hydrolase-like predicted phosphatase
VDHSRRWFGIVGDAVGVVEAVIFDVGGVLERVGAPAWERTWQVRLGLTQAEFDAAIGRVDPDGLAETGELSEGELRARFAEALRLTRAEAGELMADVWDWYCGELDEELVAYVRSLRPRIKTAILSNSADGARREESRRYDLPSLVDDVVYSHEVGLAKPDPAVFVLTCDRLGVPPARTVFVDDAQANMDAAAVLGLLVVLHRDTGETIAAVKALIDGTDAAGPAACLGT